MIVVAMGIYKARQTTYYIPVPVVHISARMLMYTAVHTQ